MKKFTVLIMAVLAGLVTLGCDDGSKTGSIQFFVQPEWTITSGIQPGDGEEDMRDGWTVEYERFMINIGDIIVARSDSSDRFKLPARYIVDLKNAPQGGLLIGTIDGIEAGNWDQVSYGILPADGSSQKLGDASQEDFDRMVNGNIAVSVRMKLTNPSGVVCDPTTDATDNCLPEHEVVLDWDIPWGVVAGGCAPGSGEPGIVVPSGSTGQVKLTIHGDHWFFTAFRHENIERRAQHLVNCDLNHDGVVTMDELSQVPITVLDPQVYDLSTVPDATSMLDYVKWAARTLPHFQGDGGCPERTPVNPE